ncbi:MAG: DUF2130 domain-containing protein [Mycoplasmoidaceae bacterium]
MSKKINIKVKDLQKNEFFVEEDAKKGDYFCLDDIGAFSIDHIKKEFNEKIDIIAKQRIDEILLVEKKNWENAFKASEEYSELIKKLSIFEKDSSDYKEKIEIIEKQYKEKEQNIISNAKIEIGLAKKDLIIENHQKVTDLNDQIKKLENSIELIKKESIIENQKQVIVLKAEIENLKKDLERRNNKNIKLIGEDLETWILKEFDEYFPMNDKVNLKKITKSTNLNDNTMADFEFFVYGPNKEILGSAVIEAKTESETGKTKNSKHYEKLNRQRIKLNYEYAILVSELEPENTFLIKKVSDYENMFVIRPAYLMIFLSLIEYISNQTQEIKKDELNFKNKQEIQDEFEKMKNEILENSLKNINKKCEEIEKEIIKIQSSSEKIKSAIEIVIQTHISTIKNKIENFKIETIKNKTEKIS